jgi:general secretion pathway protein K
MPLCQPRANNRPQRQRGAALLTAMMIVTLVVTLAAAMVWQQWRAVQVEAAERARVQAAWILSGALDWANLILYEDLRTRKPTALSRPWATPLEEARISTFLAIDKSNVNDGPDAFLSGSITDVQSRFNLTDLLTQDNKTDPLELEALTRLCTTLNIDGSVPKRIANGLVEAKAAQLDSTRSSAAPLYPKTVDQLSWLGVDAASIKALKPYVALLPAGTRLNVNTASREVLQAVIASLDGSNVEKLMQMRQRDAFNTVPFFIEQLPVAAQQAEPLAPSINLAQKLDVFSSFFEVRAKLRLEDRVLTEVSLVKRRLVPERPEVIRRQRVSGLDTVGAAVDTPR